MPETCEHCALFNAKKKELLESCETIFEASSKLKDLVNDSEPEKLAEPAEYNEADYIDKPVFPDTSYNPLDHKPARPEDVRITVYAIAASEPKEFVDRWMASMSGADHICVLVTKKDDPDYDYFLSYTQNPDFKDKFILKQIDVKPWRFDVARNLSLAMVPVEDTDICVSIDIDELFDSSYFEDLRKTVFDNWIAVRYNYRNATSHYDDGSPKVIFYREKAHPPRGYYWKFPVHEALICENPENYHYSDTFVYMDASKIYEHHYPDTTKSRSSYLPLLEWRAKLYPNDFVGYFYLMREYTFYGKNEEAIAKGITLMSKLADKEVVDDYNMLPAVLNIIGNSMDNLRFRDIAQAYYRHGLELDPGCRSLYISLAASLAYSGKPTEAITVLHEMEKKSVYREDWRFSPIDWRLYRKLHILANAFSWLHSYSVACVIFQQALTDIKTEDDKRDAASLGFYDDFEFARSRALALQASKEEETPNDTSTD